MNAFEFASEVETSGMRIVRPYLEERSTGLVLNSKGTLSRYLQLIAGDVVISDQLGKMWWIELKTEQRHTGNLFLETWSNRNLEDRSSHAERGSNPGWMFHSRADILMYYFLDTDDLYVVNLFALKRWAFGHGDTYGRIWEYNERPQGKYRQANDTWGRIVPVADLRRDISAFRHCKVKQLDMLEVGS